MKRISLLFGLCLVCAAAMAQQAKYVFYFIGDGMGLNQINTTEYYLASVKGQWGFDRLSFADFPYTTYATSYSANRRVTDSAAAGTALATGHKTRNAMVGMNADSVAVTSIATWAKNAGKKVGISSTVSIDDATPSAFYAHQVNRGKYHAIGLDLAASGFHYFAGTDFHKPKEGENYDMHQICADNGYTWAFGYDEGKAKWKQAEKLFMVQRKDANRAIPYAIDRTAIDLTLPQIVEIGINTLTNNNKKGFFFMIEGGAIDHACHGRDAATAIHDIIDFDNAVKVALEFYKKHPKETLIVVAADHETGGIVPGNGRRDLNLELLQYQTCSTNEVTAKLTAMKKNRMKKTWEDVKQVLIDSYGLFTHTEVTWREEAELREAYETAFEGNAKEENLYAVNSALAAKAREILNKKAGISWASHSHSAGYVPVYAIGVGAEKFHGRLNNTDIPEIIAKIAGYKK
ncbi:MAG: alkaline phosphatase [Bacteroidales bacterium]|nr:alkaline phosphatase [Bacteroidales bacterium]